MPTGSHMFTVNCADGKQRLIPLSPCGSPRGSISWFRGYDGAQAPEDRPPSQNWRPSVTRGRGGHDFNNIPDHHHGIRSLSSRRSEAREGEVT